MARVLAGQSQSEIGRNLGISKVTVFHILRRARHRFRAEFARRGITSLVAYEATMAETKRCVGLDSKECSNEPSGSDGLCRSCRMRKNRAIERDTFQAKIAELAATVEFLEGKCTAAVQAVGHASRERDEAVKQAAESRIAVEQIERRMEWIMAGLTQRLISADERSEERR